MNGWLSALAFMSLAALVGAAVGYFTGDYRADSALAGAIIGASVGLLLALRMQVHRQAIRQARANPQEAARQQKLRAEKLETSRRLSTGPGLGNLVDQIHQNIAER